MLGVYTDFAEKYLAIPVYQGVKSANERFAGALNTYCIEAMMQDGKALQAGTSHFLGQKSASIDVMINFCVCLSGIDSLIFHTAKIVSVDQNS